MIVIEIKSIDDWYILAGSEGDIAGSSSEGDEHTRAPNRDQSGRACSPFGRRQFPRDSGCYDAPLNSRAAHHHHHASPHGESDASESGGFCDGTNNLDSVVEQCNNEILARVRQAQKNALNLKEDVYQPNIPNPGIGGETARRAKDSYVSMHGQTTLTDPCRRTLLTRTSGRRATSGGGSGEDSCEADQRSHSVRYVVGGGGDGVEAGAGGRGCLSEKSSDSGVSSSSLSSTHPKDGPSASLASRPTAPQNITENPIPLQHPILSFTTNCANTRTTTSNTANKNLA